jgi:hypothetical protein
MFEGFTMKYLLIMILTVAFCSCTMQESIYTIDNRSDKSIHNVTFRSDNDVVYLGIIKSQQKKSVKINSFSERNNSLSYESNGLNKNIVLCYQGLNFPAQGTVYIEDNGPRIICH